MDFGLRIFDRAIFKKTIFKCFYFRVPHSAFCIQCFRRDVQLIDDRLPGAIETAMHQARSIEIAGEGDECFLRALREEGQHAQLRGIEFVEAVDDEQASFAAERFVFFQRNGGQPALPFGVGPIFALQPVLIGGIDCGEFFQARA